MVSPLDIKKSEPIKKEEIQLTEEEAREKLNEIYNRIIKVLKRYCDLKEQYYYLIAMWIIGTYAHKQFITFPYIFLNAMRGSGKSRLMKLILCMSNNGVMANNLSESVLFRTASQRTLGIDEFEHISSKKNETLRELLNSAYKKGTCVERARKVYSEDGDDWKIERYDVYCPIIMANISGMEDVLSDRCISLIIEKSGCRCITQLLELFDEDEDILYIKQQFSVVSVCSYLKTKSLNLGWNAYIIKNYTTTLTTLTTQTTLTTLEELYAKIKGSGIDSRHLELFFPLFTIAYNLGHAELDRMILIAQEIVNAKKDDDYMENRDVSFLHFISNSEQLLKSRAIHDFIKERDILESYKSWMEFSEHDEEFKWLTSKWIGRALKRLSLVIEKKRISQGVLVRIDFKKSIEKSGMFKKEEKIA